MVCELVLFQVGEGDEREGGEEGGAFEDGAVVDRFPYLYGVSMGYWRRWLRILFVRIALE